MTDSSAMVGQSLNGGRVRKGKNISDPHIHDPIATRYLGVGPGSEDKQETQQVTPEQKELIELRAEVKLLKELLKLAMGTGSIHPQPAQPAATWPSAPECPFDLGTVSTYAAPMIGTRYAGPVGGFK